MKINLLVTIDVEVFANSADISREVALSVEDHLNRMQMLSTAGFRIESDSCKVKLSKSRKPIKS